MARGRTSGIYLRGDTWHFKKEYRGHSIRGSSRTSSREEAEAELAKKCEEIRLAEVYGMRSRRKFVEAATHYLNTKRKRSLAEDVRHLEAVMPFIGNLYLEDIHDGTLRPFVNARYKEGVKPRTINAVLQVVRHIMNLAAASWRDDQGMSWLVQAPKITLEPLENTEAKPYPLSWSEERRLFSELPLDLAEACLFSVNTGLRDQDVCALKWEWEHRVVGYDVSVFIIPSSYIKNGEDRLVVLNDTAGNVVNSRRGNGSDWVFPSPKTGKQRYRLHSTAWKSAWVRAGLPVTKDLLRGVHNLKHTFGRRLRAAGISHEDRQVLLGHTNGSVTTHYSGPEILSLLDSANKVCRERPEAVLRRADINVKGYKNATSENKKKGRIAATL